MIKNIPEQHLFDLTSDVEDLSKQLYNNTIIKCLVVPYHSYTEIEYCFKKDPFLYLFPERDCSYFETTQFILTITRSTYKEVRIITANQNIILDLPADLVRIFSASEKIGECPDKTLVANIHNIKANILENPSDQINTFEKGQGIQIVNKIVEEVNNAVDSNIYTDELIDDLNMRIDLIGEDIVRNKLTSMLRPMLTKKQQIAYLEAKLRELG